MGRATGDNTKTEPNPTPFLGGPPDVVWCLAFGLMGFPVAKRTRFE